MNTIQLTTDYDIFGAIVGNRQIYQPHLRRLISSIENKNMLQQNPIIVNERMEIIDGQHRLLAAKALNLPIYYSVVEHADLHEIQMLNANNRPWLPADYLESYIKLGKQSYITLKEFADEYRISLSIALRILAGNHSGDVLVKFRKGEFEIRDMKKAENIASLLSEVRKHSPDRAYAHSFCVSALQMLIEKIDPKIFINQLERYQLVVTRRMSSKDYLRQFENIINSGREGDEIRLV